MDRRDYINNETAAAANKRINGAARRRWKISIHFCLLKIHRFFKYSLWVVAGVHKMLKERVLGPKAKLKSAPSPLKTFLIPFWTNFGPIAFYTPLQRSAAWINMDLASAMPKDKWAQWSGQENNKCAETTFEMSRNIAGFFQSSVLQ